ncbi:PREDICTED: methyl-CpG-binding domain-containing protein 13-like isoform X2 [Lupinus angustifolius]|uniref:methyl-CpG-binding domain-containing protein 13-like isoform X2 n=1 Tax=Lupinus angustifolius TaxID=3871 RepID=UPI00092EE70F|nr:PREDICTED: methyl-CpG-binding domain-containing protein 13-like isoform X2 [Lupinus angustifolius]
MEKNDTEKSEETITPINCNTNCNSKQHQIVAKANEHPEWLPDGWDVDVRIRKSGANRGSVYKCYTDPLKGYKFYSKPEVLRYLENIKDNSCTFKKGKKYTNSHSPRNVAIENEKEEEEDNSCTSKKENRCTILHTPNDVVVEKEKEDNNCTSEKEKKCTNTHSPNNVVVEKSTVEGLPPGWIKETKLRKTRNRIKKDLLYTDPLSGYVFHSKKDVLRYLESGDIRTCAHRPSRREIEDKDKSTPSSVAKGQKLKQFAPKKQLFVELSDANSSRKGQDVKAPSGVMVAAVPTGEFVVKMHSLEDGAAICPEMEKISNPDYVQEKEHVVNVMENANDNNPGSLSKTELNVHHQFSPRLSGTEPVKLANNVIKEQTQVPKRSLRKGRTNLDADMENTSCQHFGGVPKIENVHKIQEVINTGYDLSEDQSIFKEQQHLLETDNAEDSKPEIRTNSNKSSNKRVHHIPCRASKRLAGIEYELMRNSISCDKAPKNKSKMSMDEVNAGFLKSEVGQAAEFADHAAIKVESVNKRRKSHKAPPSKDGHLEIVEDEEKNHEKSEPELSFASHYSWSDPSLESTINNLMGVLQDKDLVNNGPTTSLETDSPKTPFDKVKGRREGLEFATNTLMSVLPAEDSVDNGPTATLGSDTQKKSFDNVTGSRDRKPQIPSNKFKNKKELTVPMRLSKRLAGLEPEVQPSEKAVEYVSRKSFKEEPIATVTATLTNGASDPLDAGEETKPTPHACDRLKTEGLGESSNKSEKSLGAQTVPYEQLQKVEAESICDEISELQLPLMFGDTWSDPCLEFAFKTLTGALPVDVPADVLCGRTPNTNNLSNKRLLENVVVSISEQAHDNSNQSQSKKELNMVSQPSMQFPGQPELRTRSTTCENDPTFTTRESYNDEGNLTRYFGRQPLHTEAGTITQLVRHSRNISTPIHETKNRDNTEPQFCASLMDSWSDSCLDFAFKTLTGAIPVDENVFEGCFPEPANCHDRGDGVSTLPHFGSSSFSQSDISFYPDIGVESRPGQQSSKSSSFLPLEKANLQGFPGVDPQNHYSQWNKNFHW